MKNKKIKTEEQAKEFIAKSLVNHLNKCSEVLNEEFVGEVSLFMIATLFCEMYGAKNLERMFQEVQFNSENELDHSPECGTKNKYH